MRRCANCGASLLGLDGRHKYCSEECYTEAHRRQCRANSRRRYWANREGELERNRRYYESKKNNARNVRTGE